MPQKLFRFLLFSLTNNFQAILLLKQILTACRFLLLPPWLQWQPREATQLPTDRHLISGWMKLSEMEIILLSEILLSCSDRAVRLYPCCL